jgi:type IV pilus assembly protein PilB
MVGEIRDIETADIALKAAQTGHMVLSTLHTNDAPQTLTRLVNIGVAPYNIASSVSLIIAQRLARRLCSHCKKPVDIPRAELLREGFKEKELGDVRLFGPVGCDQCTTATRAVPAFIRSAHERDHRPPHHGRQRHADRGRQP